MTVSDPKTARASNIDISKESGDGSAEVAVVNLLKQFLQDGVRIHSYADR